MVDQDGIHAKAIYTLSSLGDDTDRFKLKFNGWVVDVWKTASPGLPKSVFTDLYSKFSDNTMKRPLPWQFMFLSSWDFEIVHLLCSKLQLHPSVVLLDARCRRRLLWSRDAYGRDGVLGWGRQPMLCRLRTGKSWMVNFKDKLQFWHLDTEKKNDIFVLNSNVEWRLEYFHPDEMKLPKIVWLISNT